jgi:hypothetical protein
VDPPAEGEVKEDSKKMVKWSKTLFERAKTVEQMRTAGLLLRKCVATDGKSHYYLISAKQERLELQAELLEFELQLQPKYGGGYAPFTRDNKHIFLKAFDDDFFTRTQRQHLVRTIVEMDRYNGGAGKSISKLLKRGYATRFFPFHVKKTKEYLLDKWATWKVKKWFNKQPIDAMRAYFGEELTLYFSWLGFYNYALITPAILGVVVFVLQEQPTDGWPNVLYAFFMMLWTTLFLEFWKRRQNVLAFEWNMIDFEASEEARPDYYGDPSLGVYYAGQWVPFEEDDPVLERINVLPTKYYDDTRVKAKMAVSCAPMFTSLGLVAVIVFSVLGIRLFFQRTWDDPTIGGGVGSVLGAVFVVVCNILYKKMAVLLNEWENHRTQTSFDDNLITKTILFQFVNTFTSLYYIAFFKNGFNFEAIAGTGDPNFKDACKTVRAPEDTVSGDVVGSGCMSELSLQLFTLMAVNLLIGQTKEIVIPTVKVYIKKYFGSKEDNDAEAALPEWEAQARLVPYEGTFDEYAEMAIQYGLVTVFSAAFPLAAIMALANNFTEIRTDAIKILTTNNKPFYKGAQDIGGWYKILDLLGIIAVVTNSMLFGMGFAAIPKLVGPGKYGTSFNTFIVCIAIEHVLFLAKFVIAEIVPDMPGSVEQALARQSFIKNETLKSLSSKPHFKFLASEEKIKAFTYDTHPDGAFLEPYELRPEFGAVDPAELQRAESGTKKKKSKDKKKKKKKKKKKGDDSSSSSDEE